MNGEIKRTFVCCRCDHQETIRQTYGFSLNCDFPSREANSVFQSARLGRRKCSQCGGTMHPDEKTTNRIIDYSTGIGRAFVFH